MIFAIFLPLLQSRTKRHLSAVSWKQASKNDGKFLSGKKNKHHFRINLQFYLIITHNFYNKTIELFHFVIHIFYKEVLLAHTKTFLAFSWFHYQNFLKTFLAKFQILMYCAGALKDTVKLHVHLKKWELKSKI